MLIFEGSGCDSVGRTVASYTRVLQFNSYHRQILFTINCIKKTKIQKKRPWMANYKNTIIFNFCEYRFPAWKLRHFISIFKHDQSRRRRRRRRRRVALLFEIITKDLNVCQLRSRVCTYLPTYPPTYIERKKHSLRWGQFKTFKHDLKFFNLHTTYLALVAEIS